jgi:parallel beta-helix repeat protein
VREGIARIDLPSGTSRKAWLLSVSALNTESTVDLSIGASIAAGNGTNASMATRVSGGDAYLCRTRIGAGGEVAVQLSRVNEGTETVVASEQLAPLLLADWEWLRVRTSIAGTSPVTLRMKVWKIGTAEPSSWQLQSEDSSAKRIVALGSVGLYAYESRATAGGVLELDNLVTTLDGGLPAQPLVPTPDSGRGSLPVGSARYAVPEAAVFVAPNGDDGASGASASPFRTLQHAVDVAGWNQTIVLRAGRYNQTVFVANAKSVTIQAYPGEAVWLDGTVPVAGWQPFGGRWTSSGWTVEFDRAVSTNWGDDETSWWVGPQNSLAGYRDQLFLDGIPLRQVRTAGDVTAGTFAVDYARDELILGSDPSGHEVRASNLEQAVRSGGPGVVVRGIGVRGYATPAQVQGTVLLAGSGSRVENVVISDNAMMGLSLIGRDSTADHVTVTTNGVLGIHADMADGLSITNSVVRGNNSEHFNEMPEAAGMKITRTRGLTVANNDVQDNNADGIWLDQSDYQLKIVGNRATGNTCMGIEVEISDTGVVAGNVVAGNEESSLFVFDSGNLQIYNNYLGENRYIQLHQQQDERRQSDPSFMGHDPRRPIPDPLMPWLTRNNVAANNVIGPSGIIQFYAADQDVTVPTTIPADSINLTVNGNVFTMKSSTSGTLVGWGTVDVHRLDTYDDLNAFAAAKNSAWRNVAIPWVSRASSLSTAGSLTIGVPLPSEVAQALGVPSGSTKIGPFIG